MSVVAGIVVAVAVVPSIFWVGVEETFALPKLIALGTVTALCTIALVVALGLGQSLRRQLHVMDALVATYLLFVAVSFVLSVDRDLSLWGEHFQRQGFASTVFYVAFYGLARIAVTDGCRLGMLVRWAAAGATFAAAYAVVQRVGLDPIWTELPQGRVFSTIGQPNSLGAYMAMSIPLGIASASVEHRPAQRRLWWLAVALQTTALFFTLSRGAYLAVAVAVGFGLVAPALLRVRRYGKRVVMMTGIGVVAVAAVITLVPTFEETGERAIARTFSTEDLRTGSIRDHLDLWEVAINITADQPIFGTGPDTFPEVFDDYRDEVLELDRAQRFAPHRVESAHNIYLTTAAGSGLPAAVALAATMCGGIYLALRRSSERANESEGTYLRAAGAALVAHAISNFFITAELAGSLIAWVLLGSIVTISARPPASSPQPDRSASLGTVTKP